jgi:hypothetical protein
MEQLHSTAKDTQTGFSQSVDISAGVEIPLGVPKSKKEAKIETT